MPVHNQETEGMFFFYDIKVALLGIGASGGLL